MVIVGSAVSAIAYGIGAVTTQILDVDFSDGGHKIKI